AGGAQRLEDSPRDSLPLLEGVPLVAADVVRDVGGGVPEEVLQAVVERDRVGSIGKLLAVDADGERAAELRLDVPAQGLAAETARDGEVPGLGSRGVEELEEERSPGRPVPLDRELAGHGRGEPDAIRVDVLLRASRDLHRRK